MHWFIHYEVSEQYCIRIDFYEFYHCFFNFSILGESESNNKGGWRYAPESVEIVTEDMDDLPLPKPLRPSPPLKRKSLQPVSSAS